MDQLGRVLAEIARRPAEFPPEMLEQVVTPPVEGLCSGSGGWSESEFSARRPEQLSGRETRV